MKASMDQKVEFLPNKYLSLPHKTVSFDFLFSNGPKLLGGHIYTEERYYKLF